MHCTALPCLQAKAKALAHLAEVAHQAQVLAVEVVAAVRVDDLRGARTRQTQPRPKPGKGLKACSLGSPGERLPASCTGGELRVAAALCAPRRACEPWRDRLLTT